MTARKGLFLVFVCLFLSSHSHASFDVCRLALKATGSALNYLGFESKKERLAKPAKIKARIVLGALYPEDHETELQLVTCLNENGCRYHRIWNVIQMDQERLFQNEEAFGVIYIHELAHAIQAQKDPSLNKLRDELGGIRKSQLRDWTRYHRRKNVIDKHMDEAGLWGLWYWTTSADIKLHLKGERIFDKYENAYTSYKERNPGEKDAPSALLQNSPAELFADLASCAAYSDGEAIVKSLKVIDKTDHPDRSNATAAEIPFTMDWQLVENLDEHSFLKQARRIIWNKYLNGKTNTEVQRVLGVLERTTREWPESRPKDIVISIDGKYYEINSFNRSFLQRFEQDLRNAN